MKLVRTLAVLGLAACSTRESTAPIRSDAALDLVGTTSVAAVYTQTNDATANAVKLFTRAADGTLTFVADYPTGGKGNGAAGLGSQGAITIAEDRFVLVVNAGSNEISSFRIGAGSLTLVETIPSGGVMPISVGSWGRLVYVLNAGSDNVTGFLLNNMGDLTAIPGSTRSLSGTGTGPAQVEFTPNGRRLVVTEKNTNKIDLFLVNQGGTLSGPTVHPSSGMTPFGFAFDGRGHIIVSEAIGGAPNASATSSYRLGDPGLTPISTSVPTTETAACWVVITGNKSYAYVTNTGSNTVTGYSLAPDGVLRRLDDNGVTATTQTGPIDAGVSLSTPEFLYTLDRGSGAISIFRVNANGSLTPVATQTGLPTTSYGLAVR